MIDLATESRPEVLRQVAQLQLQENAKLQRRIGELVARLAELEGKDASAALQIELVRLQEQLEQAHQELFGRSSEQRPAAQPDPNAEKAEPATPRRGHGSRPQPTLPVVEVVHTLDAADQTCTACGGALREWEGQFEASEEVDVVAASYRVVRHQRQKYTCTCGACVETALGPQKLVPGGRYSIGFAVSVAVAKYLDHLPLARQVRQMARAGLAVDTQTLWDQLLGLSRHLEPTYEALHGHVLAAPVIGADETVWPLLEKGGAKRWYAWSVTAPDAVFYRIDPSRSAQAAAEILGAYAGIVVCDGYGAYTTLARASRDGPAAPGFTLAHCWAHVRRKFFECERAFPEAAQALDAIGQLYDVEAEAKKADVADPRAHLAALRAERSRPLVQGLRTWMLGQRALPQSGLGRALAYAHGLWPGLVRFLDDPAIPLDNNATERAMRGLVVGRKNHYGSKSLRGTQVAALFYSLLESAKLAGIEPAAYLAEATRRAIAQPRRRHAASRPHRRLIPFGASACARGALTSRRVTASSYNTIVEPREGGTMNASFELCTLVLEFNYTRPNTGLTLGSVWLFAGDGRKSLEGETPLAMISGWVRVIGPVDYELAGDTRDALKSFFEQCGVQVIAEGIAD